ncbi:MAG: HD-GYP domain-containing protein [Chloroflexi bacterium]|nr:HD-GYP domain-containing protein [Chloroflexota bacterium]MBT3669794.1 HD-GYP domain-containing protein [Chloroflexota bacterium]MBT4304695.1 HD-GYP domain-containing protein [Chloroflexota bacterium]MBT4534803.1 HD-GYP domain-containing protein [Chloroflexota bacterium]MBT4683887.1 HD-GYP domain-containing protein [Chloroflexota bacterium]
MGILSENIVIETIPLPLAGVLFSDSIHSIVLKQHHIDASVILFEKTPEEYFINSRAGFETNGKLDEKFFSNLCIEFTKKLATQEKSNDPIILDMDNMLSLEGYVDLENFNSFRVFKISDYLNTAGYWFMFYKNGNKPQISDNPFDLYPGSKQLIEAIKETIEYQSKSIAKDEIISQWVKLLDLRDKETEEHTVRVARLAQELAINLGLPDDEVESIKNGALLHDIGKLVIHNNILQKKGPLSKEEWQIMKLHPSIARELLSSLELSQDILDIPMFHHERWSGTGYPFQLKGRQIPLAARIFAVVDVWDALNSNRPYRKKFAKVKVDQYLRSKKGIDFDPKVVDKFLELHGTDTIISRKYLTTMDDKRINY